MCVLSLRSGSRLFGERVVFFPRLCRQAASVGAVPLQWGRAAPEAAAQGPRPLLLPPDLVGGVLLACSHALGVFQQFSLSLTHVCVCLDLVVVFSTHGLLSALTPALQYINKPRAEVRGQRPEQGCTWGALGRK